MRALAPADAVTLVGAAQPARGDLSGFAQRGIDWQSLAWSPAPGRAGQTFAPGPGRQSPARDMPGWLWQQAMPSGRLDDPVTGATCAPIIACLEHALPWSSLTGVQDVHDRRDQEFMDYLTEGNDAD